jgi:hypothetical protein
MSLFSCFRLKKKSSFKGSRSSWTNKGFGKQGKTLSFIRNMSRIIGEVCPWNKFQFCYFGNG